MKRQVNEWQALHDIRLFPTSFFLIFGGYFDLYARQDALSEFGIWGTGQLQLFLKMPFCGRWNNRSPKTSVP